MHTMHASLSSIEPSKGTPACRPTTAMKSTAMTPNRPRAPRAKAMRDATVVSFI